MLLYIRFIGELVLVFGQIKLLQMKFGQHQIIVLRGGAALFAMDCVVLLNGDQPLVK